MPEWPPPLCILHAEPQPVRGGAPLPRRSMPVRAGRGRLRAACYPRGAAACHLAGQIGCGNPRTLRILLLAFRVVLIQRSVRHPSERCRRHHRGHDGRRPAVATLAEERVVGERRVPERVGGRGARHGRRWWRIRGGPRALPSARLPERRERASGCQMCPLQLPMQSQTFLLTMSGGAVPLACRVRGASGLEGAVAVLGVGGPTASPARRRWLRRCARSGRAGASLEECDLQACGA
mmetsp:Transcript_167004/g.536201  ORF Transcript_167004/g.536201 Transcript_167004/m.536201 type:complete len:236 (+) Transcript_167004:745-1452(+)